MITGMRGSWMTINGRRMIMAAVAGAATLGAASVTQAHDDDHYWKKWRRHAPYYVTVPGYYVPPPVVYAPQPIVVYPEPMAYAPAYPSYYGPPPNSVNFNFSLPLR